MAPLNPLNFIMQALSTMTGGLISDIQSLIMGAVVVAFLFMGFEELYIMLDKAIQSRSRDRYMGKAADAFNEMKGYDEDSFMYQHTRAQYRRYLNKSLE